MMDGASTEYYIESKKFLYLRHNKFHVPHLFLALFCEMQSVT